MFLLLQVTGVANSFLTQLDKIEKADIKPREIDTRLEEFDQMVRDQLLLTLSFLEDSNGRTLRALGEAAKSDPEALRIVKTVAQSGYNGAASYAGGVETDAKTGRVRKVGKSALVTEGEALLKSPEFKTLLKDRTEGAKYKALEHSIKASIEIGRYQEKLFGLAKGKTNADAGAHLDKALKNHVGKLITKKPPRSGYDPTTLALLQSRGAMFTALQDRPSVQFKPAGLQTIDLIRQQIDTSGSVTALKKQLEAEASKAVEDANKPEEPAGAKPGGPGRVPMGRG